MNATESFLATMLRRKTPLRAKSWGIRAKPVDRSESQRGREETYRRSTARGESKARCDLDGGVVEQDDYEQHHAFFGGSRLAPAIKDELWNRACLHKRCHVRAHTDVLITQALRELALVRLMEELGRTVWAKIISLAKGTSQSALALAYQKWKLGK